MAYTIETENSTSYTLEEIIPINDLLLKEDSSYLLLESGDNIILEQTVTRSTDYSVESENSASYTLETRNST